MSNAPYARAVRHMGFSFAVTCLRVVTVSVLIMLHVARAFDTCGIRHFGSSSDLAFGSCYDIYKTTICQNTKRLSIYCTYSYRVKCYYIFKTTRARVQKQVSIMYTIRYCAYCARGAYGWEQNAFQLHPGIHSQKGRTWKMEVL